MFFLPPAKYSISFKQKVWKLFTFPFKKEDGTSVVAPYEGFDPVPELNKVFDGKIADINGDTITIEGMGSAKLSDLIDEGIGQYPLKGSTTIFVTFSMVEAAPGSPDFK